MKLMTEREQVRDVATRWRRYINCRRGFVRAQQQIQLRLEGLDTETATAADVAAIIGNSTWVVQMECIECGESTWDIVELGGTYQPKVCVCLPCLTKAAALVR